MTSQRSCQKEGTTGLEDIVILVQNRPLLSYTQSSGSVQSVRSRTKLVLVLLDYQKQTNSKSQNKYKCSQLSRPTTQLLEAQGQESMLNGTTEWKSNESRLWKCLKDEQLRFIIKYGVGETETEKNRDRESICYRLEVILIKTIRTFDFNFI